MFPHEHISLRKHVQSIISNGIKYPQSDILAKNALSTAIYLYLYREIKFY